MTSQREYSPLTWPRGNQRQPRATKAAALMEAAAAIVMLLPIMLIVILVMLEVGDYFVLKQQLSYVARQAAREVAYSYGRLGYTTMNSGGSASGSAVATDPNYINIINHISVPGIINPNSQPQFQIYFNIPNSPSLSKSYITATVTFQTGPNLPQFPLNPFKAGLLRFDATGIPIRSTCSWPIPHS